MSVYNSLADITTLSFFVMAISMLDALNSCSSMELPAALSLYKCFQLPVKKRHFVLNSTITYTTTAHTVLLELHLLSFICWYDFDLYMKHFLMYSYS